MQAKVAGPIQQHRVFIRQEIIRADIYCHQNHLELIRNMIKSGIVSDLLILRKENMLRNLGGVYLKSLPREIRG